MHLKCNHSCIDQLRGHLANLASCLQLVIDLQTLEPRRELGHNFGISCKFPQWTSYHFRSHWWKKAKAKELPKMVFGLFSSSSVAYTIFVRCCNKNYRTNELFMRRCTSHKKKARQERRKMLKLTSNLLFGIRWLCNNTRAWESSVGQRPAFSGSQGGKFDSRAPMDHLMI